MKTLALLRHAKSDWSDRGLGDFDRPLAPRGIEAAPRMGRAMRARGLVPDLVLCSSATRARETWDLVAAELKGTPSVQFRRGLYLASPQKLLEAVRCADSAAGTVLMIGHNPGMEFLAAALVGPGSDPEALKALSEKYPTAALSVFTFDIAKWRDAGPDTGRLTQFTRPRDL